MSVTYLKQLQLRGFKSFNRKTVFDLSNGLNICVGPNGSGKSNVLDSLCFVLGRMSSKDLRADNFAELLFRRKTNVASEGEVVLTLDNEAKVFPYDTKEVELKRKIKRSGQTQYKINNRNVTRQQALELLSKAKIFPDGHNIILQGDIARFVDMKPIHKRQVIEEIAGIGFYEDRKNKALQELAKVDERLKEVDIILSEKGAYMKNLEKEKADAEKYRDVEKQLKSAQATEVSIRKNYALAKKEKIDDDISSKNNELENLKLDIQISKQKISDLTDSIKKLDKQIEEKGGPELTQLQKDMEELRIESEKSRNLIASSLNEIERIEVRKVDLDKNLNSIQQKISEKQSEKSELEKREKELSKKLASFKRKVEETDLKTLEDQAGALESNIETLAKERQKLNEQRHEMLSEIKILESQIQTTTERLADFTKSRASQKVGKVSYDDIIKEINKLANEDSKLALQIGNLRKELIKKEAEAGSIRIKSGAHEVLLQDKAIGLLKRSGNKNILGTVAELGQVDPEYSVALKVAAGARLKNVVVENTTTAIRCLQDLKNAKAGIATFLPLDKIKTPDTSSIPKTVLNNKEVFGLASELINCQSKYKRVFQYIFGNTLIVKDVNTAKSLGISSYRMVTLDGDVFDRSGAITGGYRPKSSGLEFEDTRAQGALVKLESDLESIKSEMEGSERRRLELDSQVTALRAQKAELGDERGAKDKIKLINDLQSASKENEHKIKLLNSSVGRLEKELTNLDEALESKAEEKNSVRARLRELQFGEQSKELSNLNEEKNQIDSRLAALTATLENGLLPEQENITKVLSGLGKERKTFDRQAKDTEILVGKLDKKLEAREKESEKFHGALRKLTDTKTKLSSDLREAETNGHKFGFQIGAVEKDKHQLSINKAEISAQITALDEEMEDYKGAEILSEIKNLEEAKKEIRNYSASLTRLGNVNMRALEIFESVEKEYEELATKSSKLADEKNHVLGMIDDVEKRKKESFMKTYDEVAKNFEQLHSKIADKNFAVLELENKENPFEGGVSVNVKDLKGKRMSLASLSGGEKVLVALSFIFAIQDFEPAPFYLLDEIDAALDKVNSEKVGKLLKEYSKRAQVIMISHNDNVVSEADNIYGISMLKTGESNVYGLKV